MKLITPANALTVAGPGRFGSALQQVVSLSTTLGLIVLIPIFFFVFMGVVYFIARAFGGQGTFLEQCNASLLYQVPVGLGGKLLAFLPLIGKVLTYGLSVYGIVLQVVAVMAAHRLSTGKALAVVVLSLLALLVLVGVIALPVYLLK